MKHSRAKALSAAALTLLLITWAGAVESRSGQAGRGFSHAGSDRRLHQATAVADSRAVAGSGSTASSNVQAGAVSTGKPATAVSQGAAIAGENETVRVNCQAFAVDSEDYKRCINTNATNVGSGSGSDSSGSGSGGAVDAGAAAAAATADFNAAPACAPPVADYKAVDTAGRLWGYQNGTSCVYRLANGAPTYLANITSSEVAAGAATSFEGAPACSGPPTPANTTRDAAGNLWGFQNNASCTYRDASGGTGRRQARQLLGARGHDRSARV